MATLARSMCDRCRRPTSVCYCATLTRIETRTRVVILQHPRERTMPIGTARMASLCLPNAELRVGMRWTEDVFAQAGRTPILLYPGPGAKDILREPPSGPVTLVVVDGTWSQARSLVRDNPALRALPRYAFATPEPSHYRIRREPKDEYVSTIEALMHVLGALEGEPERFRALLDPFHAMIDAHLAARATRAQRTSYRKPGVPQPRLPRVPAELARWDDLVCVVGEANAWPYTKGETRRDELVHWTACRVATGETFETIVAPVGELAPNTVFHTALPEDVLRAGTTLRELQAAWAAFARPGDIYCAWGHYGPNLFGLSGPRLDLRACAQRLERAKLGGIESYAGEVTPMLRGRAGRRLAMLVAMLNRWRALLRPSEGDFSPPFRE